MMNRLFISLDFNDEFLEKIINLRNELAESFSSIRWEPKNKLHLTLKFIGDIDTSFNNNINQAIEKVLKNYQNIELVMNCFSMFNRNNQPSILWAGFEENNLLKKFVNDIEEELNLLGIEKNNKKFKAHLTLLRLRGNENPDIVKKFINYKVERIITNAKSVTLFKSILKSTGSEYFEINKYDLK